jgi:hypothetical protein
MNNNNKKKKNKSLFKDRQQRQQIKELEAQTIRNSQQMREQAVMNAIAAENASSTPATRRQMFDAIQKMLESHGRGHELENGRNLPDSSSEMKNN